MRVSHATFPLHACNRPARLFQNYFESCAKDNKTKTIDHCRNRKMQKGKVQKYLKLLMNEKCGQI